ncbi:MAG: hypothetical protein RL272_272 [Candidatus Parcubacteria bacterium]
MRRLLLLMIMLLSIAARPASAQDGGTTVAPRVVVMPFENRAASRGQGPFSFGLPAMLAERLESDPGLVVLDGPLVLTSEQTQLVSPAGASFDLAAANRLALARGATHFVAGYYSGQVWQWTYVVDVYAADPAGPTLVGEGTASGDLTVAVTLRGGRTAHPQSAARIHGLFSHAVTEAFSAAGIPLAPGTSAAIATPGTNDAYAFLLLSRAYARHFGPSSPESAGPEDTPLAIAEHAVLVDPTYAEAQRFYAHLLHEADRNVSARAHFEAALARRGDDVRTLIELAEIEVGERNPDVARDYLLRAVAVRPRHAVARYWLGRAYLDLADPSHAIEQFELARSIDPSHVEARRALVRLYADARRYEDAAEELRAVTAQVPGDADAAFLLAACLRAAGRRDDAIAAYASAAAWFPGEARFHSFRADLLMEAGRNGEARAEYETARRLAPRDARIAAVIDAPDAPATRELLGGSSLVSVIAAGVARALDMESSRSVYMLAINDAILDLQINGSEACRDGHGASSALLAREEGARYWTLGQAMTSAARGIGSALDRGEGAALTPDEARNARAVLAAMEASERDVREMRSLFQTTFIPSYRRRACETFDGPITAATPDAVRARYADRRVVLPEVRPPTYSMPISPVFPSMPARSITFRVNNAEGRAAYVLTIDGTEMGEVPPGRSATFSSRLGPHRICLIPRGARCGDPGTERSVFLHERWTIRVRPGSP